MAVYTQITNRTMPSTKPPEVLTDIASMETDDVNHFLLHQGRYHSLRTAIIESFNADLLEEVRKSLWGANHGADDLRTLAEVHRQKAERLDKNYTPQFEFKKFNTMTTNTVDIESWETVYNSLTVKELLDGAVHIQAEQNTKKPDRYRILLGFAFYKTLDEQYLIDAFDLDNRGAGLSVDEQASRVSDTLTTLAPVVGGLLCGFINKVTTNASASSNSYGSAKNDGRWLNILSDRYAGGVSTVAHEIGHAIQYAFGINCNSNIDNRDATSEFEKDFSVQVSEREPFDDFQQEIKYLWEQYTDNDLEEVREYQEKNFNEFFACAFEYWAADTAPIEYEVFFNKHLAAS